MLNTSLCCWTAIICLKHSTETLNITNSMMRPATVQCCKCVNLLSNFTNMHNNNRKSFKSRFNHIVRCQGFDLTNVHVEHNDDLANECIM